MNILHLSIVSPEQSIFDRDVAGVIVPSEDGFMEILPGHTPLLATLRKGDVTVRIPGGNEEKITVDNGIMEVVQGNVTILI